MKGAYSIFERMFGYQPDMTEEQYNDRYSLTVKTKDRSRKTYCFSTPIRRINTGELVDFSFDKREDYYAYAGSNSNFIIKKEGIDIQNNEGFIHLETDFGELRSDGEVLRGNGISIYPNLNGIRIKHHITDHKNQLVYKFGYWEYDLRNRTKAVSFMLEPFRSFMTITPIGCFDAGNRITGPVIVSAKETGTKTGIIDLVPYGGRHYDSIEYEICLCERKLFLDTTVSSRLPDENNAFGGISFLGNSDAFGREMLYSRIDPGVLKDIKTERIKKAVLHIPKLSAISMKVRVGTVKERFCSFGSTWNNKVENERKIITAQEFDRFYSIDISDKLIGDTTGDTIFFPGIILGSKGGINESTIISTGDCCSFPQILEITQ